MILFFRILFLLFFCIVCYAQTFDSFIAVNNSAEEQKIIFRFNSRLLLKNNEIITAPVEFSFISSTGEKVASITPDSGEFNEFQRKNFDVVTEREFILAPNCECEIFTPYQLTRFIIATFADQTFGFDIDQLFYMGPARITNAHIQVFKDKKLARRIKEAFKFSKDHNVPDPEKERTKPLHLKCPAPLIREIYGKTAEDALEGIDYLEGQSLGIIDKIAASYVAPESLAATSREEVFKTHRMWITSHISPKEPSAEQLEYYINSVARLNLKGIWVHKFWCWNKEQLPETIKILENCGQNIQIAEFSRPGNLSRIKALHFVFAAIDHELFTLAGNILRNNVVDWDGGFYTDIGAEIKRDIAPLLRHSDIIAHHRIGRVDPTAWFLDHDFLGARKPGNTLIQEFLNRVSTLHELAGNPKITEFFNQTPRLTHALTNARLLTEVFSLFSKDKGIKTLGLPNDECIIRAHHQTSWYGGDGKSCKDIDKTTLNWFKVAPDYALQRDRLLQEGFNVELYKQRFAPTLMNPGELTHHFLTRKFNITTPFVPSAERPRPVVINLTTWSKRIHAAYLAIASLENQTFKPNNVILWLADEEFPGREIPSSLTHLTSQGIEIRWCEKNIRSSKKLLPALNDPELSETLLITMDDDLQFRPDWLETLYVEHIKHPTAIIAHRTRVMKFNTDSTPAQYSKWRLLKDPSKANGEVLFPTSGAGILFPPHSLHPESYNIENLKYCPTGDDILWFTGAILQGTEIRVPPVPQTDLEEITDQAVQDSALWLTNQAGKNDEMIRNLFAALKEKGHDMISLLNSRRQAT